MRRSFVLFLPILALTVTISGAGEDRKEKGGSEKPRPADKAKTDKGKAGTPAPFFDADEFFKLHDKNKDGFLSKDELPVRFRHAFEQIDANKDGKISKEELHKGFVYLQPRRRPSDVVFVLVEMSDCDECCADELQVIYEFLHKLDKNKDGKIDADELKAGRTDLIAKHAENLIKDLDANGDGQISKDEARGRIKEHFDKLDANKDGKISKEELIKAITERPAAVPKDKAPAEKGGAKETPRDR